MSKVRTVKTKTEPMNVASAIDKAKQSLSVLFPDFAGSDLRLEEIETPVEAQRWRITFSAATKNDVPGTNALADLLRATRPRKTVELEADNGELLSVKAA